MDLYVPLAQLHDTLTLPTPAASRVALSEQIFSMQQEIARTRQEASMADMLGLPTHRLQREIVWGEQCLNALLEAWDVRGSASA